MLKFIRKYKQGLLVVAGVLLMIAFLVPGAIQEWGSQRANVTVMKIGQKKLSAIQFQELAMQYQFLNSLSGGTLSLSGITEGPEQWVLLVELAKRGGYIGANANADDIIEELGRTRGLVRLRMQYGEQLFNSLMSQPQLAGFLQGELDKEIQGLQLAFPRLAAEARMTEEQTQKALDHLQGVQRLIRAASASARVSTPRAILRAERDLEGAQVEYIFINADRQLPNVPEPDDAALQAFMDTYKDVRPGEGEYGIGYLLPQRVKIEYMVLDQKKISDKIVPDLKELRRRFNELPDKTQTFDQARANLEQTIKKETVERVMGIAQQAVQSLVSQATRTFEVDGQFKTLPSDWSSKRIKLADMVGAIVARVEEKTRPEPGKPGIVIDAPEVVVKETSFLTREDLAALELIGPSFITRGQNRIPFADYALAVHELLPTTNVSLQVGLPSEEPTRNFDGSMFYFTILDTRSESVPRTIDEVREKLVADWKRVEAYKLLVAQDREALLQKAIAEGIASLDDTIKNADPTKPPPTPQLKSGRVTRTSISTGDANVNTDIFRLAVIEAAEKLDPLVSADEFKADARTLAVPLPQKLGIAVARIRTLVPLTIEDFRGQQNRLVNQFQLDEFRNLKSNPFSLDRLRQRLNVKNVGANGDEADAEANVAG